MRACIALGVGVWLYLAVAFHPGILTPDSADQLRQALTGEFHDWHPPFLALLWRGIALTPAGPSGFFALQAGMVAAALAYAAGALLRRPLARTALVAAALVHPILFSYWPLLAKDIPAATGLLTFHAAVIALVRPPWTGAPMARPRLHATALAAGFLVAVLSRHELALALAPAAALLAATLVLRRLERARVSVRLCCVAVAGAVPFAAAATLAAAAAAGALVGGATGAEHRQAWQAIMIYDLASEAARGRIDPALVPFDRDGDVALDELARGYTPTIADFLFWGGASSLDFRQDEAALSDLREAWIAQKLERPGAYLSHRWAVTLRSLSIGVPNPWPFTSAYASVGENNAQVLASLGLEAQQSVFAARPRWWAAVYTERVAANQEGMLLNQGWFHVLALAVLAAAALAACATPAVRRDPLVAGHALAIAVLGAGGLAHVAILAFASPGYVPRYLVPCMLALTAAAVLATAAIARLAAPRAAVWARSLLRRGRRWRRALARAVGAAMGRTRRAAAPNPAPSADEQRGRLAVPLASVGGVLSFIVERARRRRRPAIPPSAAAPKA